jgi:hypothetical protein
VLPVYRVSDSGKSVSEDSILRDGVPALFTNPVQSFRRGYGTTVSRRARSGRSSVTAFSPASDLAR